MKWIKQWIKRRIEYRRRLIALWIACRYGSNNDNVGKSTIENILKKVNWKHI